MMNKKEFTTVSMVLLVLAVLVLAGIWHYESNQPLSSLSASSTTSQSSTDDAVTPSINQSSSKPVLGSLYLIPKPHSLEITSPQAGHGWVIGTSHAITWIPPKNVAEVVIKLESSVPTAECATMGCLYNSGQKSYLLTTQGTPAPNTGSFLWDVGSGEYLQDQIPAEIPPGMYSVIIEGLDATGSSIPGGISGKSHWFDVIASTATPSPSSDSSSAQ